MRNVVAGAVLATALCSMPAAPAAAQTGEGPRPAGIPIAGPAPQGDYLPPLPPEKREDAAVWMLRVVVIGLIAVFLLLNMLARRNRAAMIKKTPEMELVERAEQILAQADAADDGNEIGGS